MTRTIRRIECNKSGYVRLQNYPTPSNYNGKKNKGTTSPEKLIAIAKNNEKIAVRCFTCYVLNNFTPKDYCLTLTFPTDMPDKNRCKEMKNCIARLRYLYSKYNTELRFILVWGRGDDKGMLHCHILINNNSTIKYHDIWAVINKYSKKTRKTKHNYHIQKINQRSTGRTKMEIMKSTCYYLIKHWDTIKPNDETIVNRRWFKSNNVHRPSVYRYSEEYGEADFLDISPSKMMKMLFEARRNGNIGITIEKIFPDLRLPPNALINFFHDERGRWHFEAEVIVKGSLLDDYT